VSGTLDAQGNTTAGQPAPIPGSPELRTALVAAAFKAAKGDPVHLQDVANPGGSSSYYAVQVEEITAPAKKPFDQVRDAVLADWTRNARRHAQEVAAAKMLGAIKSGQSMADAATIAGVTVRRSAAFPRAGDAPGVPAQLVAPLFSLKQGEPTMTETPDGFVVAVVAEIQTPDAAADPIGYGQMREQLTRSIAEDLQMTLAAALRDRGKPQINRTELDTLVPQ
jgi:peptidyl-prolyl cis-trans isomerase D